MSRTVAYPLLKELAHEWEKLFPSAVCAGIVPDARHERRGGYHVGRAFQPSTCNYSVVRRDDGPGCGPSDAAAAVDMGMNRRDMIECTRRLKRVWENPKDPRRKYLNAFNGWLGSGDAERFDIAGRKRGRASNDHRTHVHLEVRRKYVKVRAMLAAVLSALRGETVAEYLRAIGAALQTAAVAVASVAAGRRPAAIVVPAYPGRVLRRGAGPRPDPALKRWQQRMRERGWRSLDADGLFGPGTERVVRQFQRRCKLPADGMIGPKTWPLPWTKPLAGD